MVVEWLWSRPSIATPLSCRTFFAKKAVSVFYHFTKYFATASWPAGTRDAGTTICSNDSGDRRGSKVETQLLWPLQPDSTGPQDCETSVSLEG